MSDLERRYRRLLHAYPASYRAERGDEMLGTLLEASKPGQSRPAARDVRALLLGGLRVRAWQGQRQSPALSMRQVLFLAAVFVLATRSIDEWVAFTGPGGFRPHLVPQYWVVVALAVLFAVAAASAWSRRRWAVVVVAVVTGALSVYQLAARPHGEEVLLAILPLLALSMVAIMVSRRERLPGLWLWLTGLTFLGLLLPWLLPESGSLHRIAYFSLLTVFGLAVVWSVIDARIITAIVLWYALAMTNLVLQDVTGPGGGHILLHDALAGLVLIIFAIAAAGTWLVRRQAVL